MPTNDPARAPGDPIALARDNWIRHGWQPSADGMAAVTSIMRVQQLFLGRIERLLRPHLLTFARYEVLRLLAFSRTGTLPVGRIGERLQVHPASVTNAVQRLAEAGLVERSPNPNDGRGVLATVTDSGRELVETCTKVLNDEVFSKVPLTTARQQRLFDDLRELRRSHGDLG